MSKKYSKAAEETISKKMDKMKNEDMPHRQKVAIAIEEARKEHQKVPPKKKG